MRGALSASPDSHTGSSTLVHLYRPGGRLFFPRLDAGSPRHPVPGGVHRGSGRGWPTHGPSVREQVWETVRPGQASEWRAHCDNAAVSGRLPQGLARALVSGTVQGWGATCGAVWSPGAGRAGTGVLEKVVQTSPVAPSYTQNTVPFYSVPAERNGRLCVLWPTPTCPHSRAPAPSNSL